jgi:hypothetical protein
VLVLLWRTTVASSQIRGTSAATAAATAAGGSASEGGPVRGEEQKGLSELLRTGYAYILARGMHTTARAPTPHILAAAFC